MRAGQWAKDCLGHPPPGTWCDVCCRAKGIRRQAVADRKVGGAWAYVCEYCKYRADSARRGTR